MNALENEVKPFVATMAYRGEQTLLDVDRQLALTQWIVNTAMVYEFTASPVEARYFSEFERAAFKESFAIPRTSGSGSGGMTVCVRFRHSSSARRNRR